MGRACMEEVTRLCLGGEGLDTGNVSRVNWEGFLRRDVFRWRRGRRERYSLSLRKSKEKEDKLVKTGTKE